MRVNKPKCGAKIFLKYDGFKTRSGVSLLIALVLVSILLVFGLSVNMLVLHSIRESANFVHSKKAYYAAESAMEKGLLANLEHGAGYTSGAVNIPFGEYEFCTQANFAICSTCCGTYGTDASDCVNSCMAGGSSVRASYKIQGQVPKNSIFFDNSYGIPTPGSGNVAAGCDPLKAVTTGTFYWPAGSDIIYDDPKDHPCNWNKIKIGETVTIPLYYTDENDEAVNLFKSNTGFELKIRTACGDGEEGEEWQEFCAPLERFDLDDTQGDPAYNGNDPIVSWQIVGEDGAGGEALVLDTYLLVKDNLIDLTSTILHETKINYATGFLVLTQDSFGEDPDKCRGEIKHFLTNNISGGGVLLGCPNSGKWDSQKITKPVFKFTVIHSLTAFPVGDTIPYLEYQFIVDDTISQPTDVVQTITAEGFSGSFKQVLEAKVPHESGLLEYVIQQ